MWWRVLENQVLFLPYDLYDSTDFFFLKRHFYKIFYSGSCTVPLKFLRIEIGGFLYFPACYFGSEWLIKKLFKTFPTFSHLLLAILYRLQYTLNLGNDYSNFSKLGINYLTHPDILSFSLNFGIMIALIPTLFILS